jgi:hypothetical protein
MQDGGLAFCINNSHQYADIALIFISPTASQKVCRGSRFALANRAGGLKG